MHLLLTKFDMYLEIIILRVTNTNTCSFHQKALSKHRIAQKNKGDAHKTF
jgi:hypothetical protein